MYEDSSDPGSEDSSRSDDSEEEKTKVVAINDEPDSGEDD